MNMLVLSLKDQVKKTSDAKILMKKYLTETLRT